MTKNYISLAMKIFILQQFYFDPVRSRLNGFCGSLLIDNVFLEYLDILR